MDLLISSILKNNILHPNEIWILQNSLSSGSSSLRSLLVMIFLTLSIHCFLNFNRLSSINSIMLCWTFIIFLIYQVTIFPFPSFDFLASRHQKSIYVANNLFAWRLRYVQDSAPYAMIKKSMFWFYIQHFCSININIIYNSSLYYYYHHYYYCYYMGWGLSHGNYFYVFFYLYYIF